MADIVVTPITAGDRNQQERPLEKVFRDYSFWP